jgi:hypothetical protein
MITNNLIQELIETCKVVDEQYKQQCEKWDADMGSSSYKDGINIEYCIEAADWHRISLALRKLQGVK